LGPFESYEENEVCKLDHFIEMRKNIDNNKTVQLTKIVSKFNPKTVYLGYKF